MLLSFVESVLFFEFLLLSSVQALLIVLTGNSVRIGTKFMCSTVLLVWMHLIARPVDFV